jgi:hypothetical protein
MSSYVGWTEARKPIDHSRWRVKLKFDIPPKNNFCTLTKLCFGTPL